MYTTMYTMVIYSIGVQQQESWGLNNDSCRDTIFSKRNEHPVTKTSETNCP